MLGQLSGMSNKNLWFVYPDRLIHLFSQLLEDIAIFPHDLLKYIEFLSESRVVRRQSNSTGRFADIKRVTLFNVEQTKNFFG